MTHGFELVREERIAELNGVARLYTHVKTGAQLLSLINDDENKCFGINFRTPIDDSTGVAHILEHSVLCGSRKYAVKDPFIELAKGSMNTFLNAFTYPDKTCYPVASQNLQDFYNLIDVYLDTVFYPLLTLQTFQEQGWHYEIERPDETMIYKGVVFNEMKGAYSSPDRVLYKQAMRSLFPDTIYRSDSGGDPRHIIDLTHEQLREFHRTFYHPSNSLIFFYGDDDPTERLRRLDAALSEFGPLAVDATVPLQPRFSAPQTFTKGYAVGQESEEEENKAMVSVNWMLTEGMDPKITLALGILEQILVGNSASPLRKALIDSGLGTALTSSGLENDLRQMMFTAGLKGIAAENAEKVEELILTTLRELADDGIDPAFVEAALNTVEFALRENNTGSFPRGLSMMLRALAPWVYGGDPFAPLAYEAPLEFVKSQVNEGRFFEGLIREHLLDNPHRTRVLITPDPDLDRRETEAERARLERERAEMGETGLEQAIAITQELKARQAMPDSPEALASLPALTRADLEPKIRTIPSTELKPAGVRTLYHDLFTNGVVYLDLGMDLHTLPQDLLPYVPLFGRSLLEIGTEQEDFVRLTQRIGQKTGGIRRSSLLSAVRDSDRSAAWLFLRGKATPDKAMELLDILRDILMTVKLDNRDRFRQMVQEDKARLEASIPPSGSSYLSQRLRARFNEANWVSEQMGGVNYFFFLRELAQAVDSDWPGVLAKLEQVRAMLVNRTAMLCNVTLDAAHFERFAPLLQEFLAGLPAAETAFPAWEQVLPVRREGLTIPGQVNYVGKAANLYSLGYQEHGSSMVVLNYLNTSYLWEKVRREGGAYGVSCSLDRLSGVIGFTSYRDPNLLGTLRNFDGASRFLKELALSNSELTRVIVGTIGDLDSYQLPDAKGYTSLVRALTGTDDALRQQRRDEVLATTQADFHAFGEALEPFITEGLTGVVGSQAAIEAANAEQPGAFEIVKVL